MGEINNRRWQRQFVASTPKQMSGHSADMPVTNKDLPTLTGEIPADNRVKRSDKLNSNDSTSVNVGSKENNARGKKQVTNYDSWFTLLSSLPPEVNQVEINEEMYQNLEEISRDIGCPTPNEDEESSIPDPATYS